MGWFTSRARTSEPGFVPLTAAPGGGKEVAALAARLFDPDHRVGQAAVAALANLGGDGAYEALVVALSEDVDWRTCWDIVRVLRAVGGDRALAPLAATIRDPRPLLPAAAIEEVRALGTPAAVRALVAALKELYPAVRGRAAEVSAARCDGRIADSLAAALDDLIPALDAAAPRLSGADDRTAGPAAAVMAGLLEAVRAWYDVLRPDADAGADWLSAGVDRLEKDRLALRERAVVALGEVGGPAAVEALARALDDPAPGVRARAAEALRKVGGDRAGAVLAAAIRRRGAREAAFGEWELIDLVVALDRIGGDPAALEGALAAVAEPLRGEVWRAVRDARYERAVAALPAEVPAQPLRHRDPGVRRQALEELGRSAGGRGVDVLAAALGDADRRVREGAVRGLARTGDPRGADLLAAAPAADLDAAADLLAGVADARLAGFLVGRCSRAACADAARALEAVLGRDAGRVESSVLRRVLALPDGFTGGAEFATAGLKEAARRELARRGLPADG